eukprot:GILK01010105.1.p1 GENE.GILK01010105.1~~GILK01010105.1.p1  ORF type:complete len:2033 (+),score=370.69 GILK01010105.1:843-6101(+)
MASALVEDLCVTVLQYLQTYHEGYVFSNDLIQQAQAIFEHSIENHWVWCALGSLLTTQLSGVHPERCAEALSIIEFCLDTLPVDDAHTRSEHLPFLLGRVLRGMERIAPDHRQLHKLQPALSFSLKLISRLKKAADSGSFVDNDDSAKRKAEQQALTSSMLSGLASTPSDTLLDDGRSAFNSYFEKLVGAMVHSDPLTAFADQLPDTADLDAFSAACKLLVSIQTLGADKSRFEEKPPTEGSSRWSGRFSLSLSSSSSMDLPPWLMAVLKSCSAQQVGVASIGIRTFVELLSTRAALPVAIQRYILHQSPHCQTVAEKLWTFLGPQYVGSHYQIVELMLRLQSLNPSVCAQAIAEPMVHTNLELKVEGCRRFARLWRLAGEINSRERVFTNGLFLMLDALDDEQPLIRQVARTWLAESMVHLPRIVDPLFQILLDVSTARSRPPERVYLGVFDTRRVTYAFNKLHSILRSDHALFLQRCSTVEVTTEIERLNELLTNAPDRALNPIPPKQSIPAVDGTFVEASPTHTESNRMSSISFGDAASMNDSNASSGHSRSSSASIQGGRSRANSLAVPVEDYLDLLALTALRYIQGQAPEAASSAFIDQNAAVKAAATEFIQSLLSHVTKRRKAAQISAALAEPVLETLSVVIGKKDTVMQVQLLNLLRILMVQSQAYKGPLSTTKPGQPPTAHAVSKQTKPVATVTNGTAAAGSFLGTLPAGSHRSTTVASHRSRNIETPVYESPLFLPTILKGLSSEQPTSSSARPHWVAFMISCLPFLTNNGQMSLASSMLSLVNVLCELITTCNPDGSDMLLLLSGISGVISHCIVPRRGEKTVAASASSAQPTQEAFSLTSPIRALNEFWVGLFSSEAEKSEPSVDSTASRNEAREVIFERLPMVLDTIVHAWQVSEKWCVSIDSRGENLLKKMGKTFKDDARRRRTAMKTLSALRQDDTEESEEEYDTNSSLGSDFDVTERDSDEERSPRTPPSLGPAAAVSRSGSTNELVGDGHSDHEPEEPRLSPVSGHVSQGHQTPMSVLSSNLDGLRNKIAIHDQILRLLDPLMLHYPVPLIAAVLHLWEKWTAPKKTGKAPSHTPSNRKHHHTDQTSPSSSPLTQPLRASSDFPLFDRSPSVSSTPTGSQRPHVSFATMSQVLLQFKLSAPAPVVGTIIDVLNAISCATPDRIMEAVHELVQASFQLKRAKNPSLTPSLNKSGFIPFRIRESAALHFVHTYLSKCSMSERSNAAWVPFLKLIKDCLVLSRQPYTYLWLLEVLVQLSKSCPPPKELMADKKSRNEFYDLGHQLLTKCELMAGKNLNLGADWRAVDLEEPIPPTIIQIYKSKSRKQRLNSFSVGSRQLTMVNEELNRAASQKALLDTSRALEQASIARCSLHALWTLRVWLTTVVDIIWEEKEKTTQHFVTLMPQILPTVQDRTIDNMAHCHAAVSLLASVCKLSYPLKAFKREVWDIFNHPDFFNTNRRTLRRWAVILNSIVTEDRRNCIQDLLSKITATQTVTQLFTNRDADVAAKARAMKRLCFVLFSGETDEYVGFLPAIMEKIVESLRMPQATPLHVQVLLCTRLFLLRFGHQHLTPLWPVVLTELVRIFTESTDPQLFLAAFKFLDLVALLQTEEFHLHQWMFLMDAITLSSAFSSGLPSFQPYAESFAEGGVFARTELERDATLPKDRKRRPLFTFKTVKDLSELKPHAARLSEHVYRGNVASDAPDLAVVARVIENEFMDVEDPNINYGNIILDLSDEER